MDPQSRIIRLVLLLVCVISSSQGQDVMNLRPFNIRKDQITVSGYSGGSAMATNFHMVHSSKFSGVALFSMAYYRCGNGNLIQFGLHCSTFLQQYLPIPGDAFGRYNITRAVIDTQNYAARGFIDPLEGLANQKVFVWSGERDPLIPVDVAKQNKDFYSNFVTDERNLMLTTHDAEHDFPTDHQGDRPCGSRRQPTEPAANLLTVGPQFVNCNFSGSYEMMKFMIGDHMVKPSADLEIGEFQLFNQEEFFHDVPRPHAAMREVGWIYIPEYCKSGINECLLHFHFHGCGESVPDPARRTFTHAGFPHVAEANNIIMVFPLTMATLASYNGCWDFSANSGPDYATKNGTHNRILHQMLERLLEFTPAAEDGASTIGHSTLTQFGFLISLWLLSIKLVNLQQH